MTEPLGALVVGCGQIGSAYDHGRRDVPPLSHAGAYRADERTRLAGGVDPDPAARSEFESRWEVPAYPSLDVALASVSPQLVSLCTPPEARLEPVEQVLSVEGLRAIWIEKPLAENASVGGRIVGLCEAAGVPLQVNFQRRFDPVHRRAAELAAEIGRPLQGDFRFSGTLLNYGSHAFDLFRWLIGEPTAIKALGSAEATTLVIHTADGSRGTFSTVTAGATTIFDVDIVGPGGRITLAAGGEQLLYAPAAPSSLFAGEMGHRYGGVEEGGLAGALSGGLDALVAHVDRGAALPCTGEDGLSALRLYEAAVEEVQLD